jgi:thiopeptide-type bacteriocin biosynthesis protein
VQERFIPGNEWIYYKIYTGTHTADKLLTAPVRAIAEKLLEEKLIDKWFFIRYSDPDFHLRVRFHVTSGNLNNVIGLVNKNIQSYCDSGLIWKIDISTYERELSRYAWDNIEISETLFWHDSEMVIKLLKALKENETEELVWMYCLKCIDDLLQVFEFTLNDKLNLMDELATAFGNEFKINKEVKIKIADKFRNNSRFLEQLMEHEESGSLNEIIVYRNRQISSLAAGLLKKVNPYKIRDLLGSHIHMHVNRMIRSNPRLHELVLYGILEKYYRKRYGQLNLKKV